MNLTTKIGFIFCLGTFLLISGCKTSEADSGARVFERGSLSDGCSIDDPMKSLVQSKGIHEKWHHNLYTFSLKKADEFLGQLSLCPQFTVSKIWEPVKNGSWIRRVDFAFDAVDAAMPVLLVGGVHGNESIGTLSLFRLLFDIANDPSKFRSFRFTIIPMVNPVGLDKQSRLNENKQNLNREFKKDSQEKAANAIMRNLMATEHNFFLGIDLHGSNVRDGYFLITVGNDLGLAASAFSKNPKVPFAKPDLGSANEFPGWAGSPKPLSQRTSPSDTWIDKKYCIYEPGVSSSNNEGTVKAFMKFDLGIPYSYTMEFPGVTHAWDGDGDFNTFAKPEKVEGLNRNLLDGILSAALEKYQNLESAQIPSIDHAKENMLKKCDP